MPVRSIKKSKYSLRGNYTTDQFPNGHDFESSLERDFLYLIDYDHTVTSFETQPVRIDYKEAGKARSYTPDLLIHYYFDGKGVRKPPMLCEVKYREDLRLNWKALKPKFAAAIQYANERGWKLRIITEREIRTPYLSNVKFLSGYRNIDIRAELIHEVIDIASEKNITTPEELLLISNKVGNDKAELIPAIWHQVANQFFGCDLSQKLTMTSKIWYTR